ncbi:MAG: hypothetical protein PHT69_16235, partial [Bacteroidales bacterium]|nr:hypothetical protein [Bacteroidales bacterium]
SLTRIENYNELNVLNFFSSFENVNFEAVINHLSTKDSILNSQPLHIFTLELFSGETEVVKTYKKWTIEGVESFDGIESPYDRDRLYALINNGSDFVLIQYFVFDRIIKPLSYFLEE